jgi:predicted TIM-barrel fold metal-dependent hydrolase
VSGPQAQPTKRYTVISADCHAGGAIHDYKPYLERRYHDEFDAWAASFQNPYPDLEGEGASRNWDSTRRLAELEADGIVGEVIFPNTVPPFFPQASLVEQPPPANAGDLELRWAGLRAHNRWLAEFCSDAPGRRAGIAQVLLHDVDAAVEEVGRARQAGLSGGVLLPGAPPGSGLAPLYDPVYEPLWSACEDLGLPVNHHSGSASPDYGELPCSKVMFLLEVTWFAHRALWQLIFSGVLERHPRLQLVLTEQGSGWIPEQLAVLDHFYDRMRSSGGSQEEEWGAPVVKSLSLRPSEYWARQCHVGASFIRPAEAGLRHLVGVDRIMWGSDYPHRESCFPWSRLALRLSLAQAPPEEVDAIVGRNAARLYGFDLAALAPVAERVGPTVAELASPVATDEVPEEAARCPCFAAPVSPLTTTTDPKAGRP